MRLNPYLLQFRKNNQVFSFDNDFVISNIDGLGAKTDIELAERFDGLGSMYLGSKIEPLNINIKGYILGNHKENKQLLINMFQPKVKGELLFNKKYKIEAYVALSPAPERYLANNQFELELCSPYPYWQKIDTKSIVTKGVLKEFMLPYNFNIPFMLGRFVDYNDVYNDGNNQKEYVIKIRALDKNVKSPRITQQKTGEFIELLYDFERYTNVMIDTRNNQLRAYKCNEYWHKEEEISDRINIESTAFTLFNGSNVIKLKSKSGFENLNVTIEFNEIVAGIF